ncbi:MAG: penicillin-binding protein 2 [Candidatus Sungbacteria bacterium]|nr:penicillin-binding protein 2 [Candidatus Sungbacteria bacterium]
MFFKKRYAKYSLDAHEILADSMGFDSLRSQEYLEGKIERPIGPRAPLVFILAIGLGILYLGAEAASLQLKEGGDLFAKSQENRFVVRTVFPPRGVIYDAEHKPFVDNVPSLGLVFEKNEFIRSGKADVEFIVRELGVLLHKEKSFFYEIGFPEDGDKSKLPPNIFIVRDLTPEEVVAIATRLDGLPGVKVYEGYRRVYREPYAWSHLIGFIGKVSKEDLERTPELSREEFVGKGGIEAFYDPLLRGQSGKKIVEIDSAGRETRYRLAEDPKDGDSLELTIDSELQRVSYNLLQSYTEGRFGASVVVLDPKTGAVRALLSYPGFDSNKFGLNLTKKEFDATIENSLQPLFNRAVSGEFPSGSVLKPMVAAAALEEHLIDPKKKIYDDGALKIPNPYKPGEFSIFKDWRAHGWVDFYDAIAFSANVYFYMIGGGYGDQKGLGIQKLKEYALRFGLGVKSGIDIPGEKSGFFPDPDSKAKQEPNDPTWRIGDTYNTSIGQGGVKVTPLQMASLTAAIANGGVLYKPFILNKALDAEGNIVKGAGASMVRDNLVSKESLRHVVEGMRQTVTVGTARRLASLPVSAGAKTGTAQAGAGKPHAWVTVFAPLENPEVVAVVMVEHAGEGSTVAVPIMHDILEWYFTHKSDQKLPIATSTDEIQ